MQLMKYDIRSPALRKVAEFIWHIKFDENIASGRLLPVVNTDLIINISKPIYYTSVNGDKIKTPPLHIRNIKLQPQIIDQDALCDVWGVSLYPYGAYALLGGDMSRYREQIVDLQECTPSLHSALLASTQGNWGESDVAVQIDQSLSQYIMTPLQDDDYHTINHFLSNMLRYKVGDYCAKNEIHIKRLERLFKKYIGLTPKQLQRIARFQKAGNEMLYPGNVPTIADIAYSFEYTDQMHLTKTFQEYAGVPPLQFSNDHNNVKKKLHHKDG